MCVFDYLFHLVNCIVLGMQNQVAAYQAQTQQQQLQKQQQPSSLSLRSQMAGQQAYLNTVQLPYDQSSRAAIEAPSYLLEPKRSQLSMSLADPSLLGQESINSHLLINTNLPPQPSTFNNSIAQSFGSSIQYGGVSLQETRVGDPMLMSDFGLALLRPDMDEQRRLLSHLPAAPMSHQSANNAWIGSSYGGTGLVRGMTFAGDSAQYEEHQRREHNSFMMHNISHVPQFGGSYIPPGNTSHDLNAKRNFGTIGSHRNVTKDTPTANTSADKDSNIQKSQQRSRSLLVARNSNSSIDESLGSNTTSDFLKASSKLRSYKLTHKDSAMDYLDKVNDQLGALSGSLDALDSVSRASEHEVEAEVDSESEFDKERTNRTPKKRGSEGTTADWDPFFGSEEFP
jgi:hypothetical protein